MTERNLHNNCATILTLYIASRQGSKCSGIQVQDPPVMLQYSYLQPPLRIKITIWVCIEQSRNSWGFVFQLVSLLQGVTPAKLFTVFYFLLDSTQSLCTCRGSWRLRLKSDTDNGIEGSYRRMNNLSCLKSVD
jgi:hypothetical protein